MSLANKPILKMLVQATAYPPELLLKMALFEFLEGRNSSRPMASRCKRP